MLMLLDLDFYQSIKLVNYIRASVKEGNLTPDVSSSSSFVDDKWLQPVLEDDALLFSLDDLTSGTTEKTVEQDGVQLPESRVLELEAQLSALHAQFADFRLQVDKTLERRWTETTEAPIAESWRDTKKLNYEGDYFESYSYNGTIDHIHPSMNIC
jgi:protein arginine N-methyltransferase 3